MNKHNSLVLLICPNIALFAAAHMTDDIFPVWSEAGGCGYFHARLIFLWISDVVIF